MRKSVGLAGRQNPTLQALRVVVCFSMAGCAPLPASAPSPAVVSVYQACEIDPNAWKQVTTSPQREALLELNGDQGGRPTRHYFVTSSNDTESWFENGRHDLLACRYERLEACGGGAFSTVIFVRNGQSWTAEHTISRLCTD